MLPREHQFGDLHTCASAVCKNGCGTIARQVRYLVGWGDVEYFGGIERTGSRAADAVGVWTTTVPICEVPITACKVPDAA